MAEKAPENWIGKEVTVEYTAEARLRQKGVLDSVSEHGIIVRSNEGTYFYPFGSVVRMRYGEASPSGASSTMTMVDSSEEF